MGLLVEELHALVGRYILMITPSNRAAVTVGESNQVRRFPCLPEVNSLPHKIDCNTPATVTALMRQNTKAVCIGVAGRKI
jgi:hypothetical protein